MIEIKDRAVQYPGRYQMTAVTGQSNTYDLTAVPGVVSAEGTPLNKGLLNQYLAASGTTAGTATALTLAQTGFGLFDGAYIRVKLHRDLSGAAATLNINGTGPKNIVCPNGTGVCLAAGNYLTVIYDSATGKYFCVSESASYVEGSYAGDDTELRQFQLGFSPSFLVVKMENEYIFNVGGTFDYAQVLMHLGTFVLGAGDTSGGKDDKAIIQPYGFSITASHYYVLNKKGNVYRYFAIK